MYESKSSGYPVSCPLVQSLLLRVSGQGSSYSLDTGKIRQRLHIDIPAECNDFDWDSASSPNRESISPILFRPGPQESPINVNFDYERASLGEFRVPCMCAIKD